MSRSTFAFAIAVSTFVAFGVAGAIAPPRAPAPRDRSVAGFEAIDLDGRVHRLGGRSGTAPFALVFLGVDCPISRKAIPKLNELVKAAAKAGRARIAE